MQEQKGRRRHDLGVLTCLLPHFCLAILCEEAWIVYLQLPYFHACLRVLSLRCDLQTNAPQPPPATALPPA